MKTFFVIKTMCFVINLWIKIMDQLEDLSRPFGVVTQVGEVFDQSFPQEMNNSQSIRGDETNLDNFMPFPGTLN